jgi:DNA helicase-2/ATP-dependent DNA helicase PcrA
MSNKLVIASAGSGKTTHLVDLALSNSDKKVLITTYTQANQEEIKAKILKKNGTIPGNLKIITWFSFLLQHLIKPFQGALDERLFEFEIKGLLLVNTPSGVKKRGRFPIYYKEVTELLEHYFSRGQKIYSDKLSKFVVNLSKKDNGNSINRLSKIFDLVLIDEVQDLAGYDLDVIKLLMKNMQDVIMVGDPRQVTYLTHHSSKYAKYRNGNIEVFLTEKCNRLIKKNIDKTSLLNSHRNNNLIANYGSKLYPQFPVTSSCTCCSNYTTGHDGIFIIQKKDVSKYLELYKPVQLKWNNKVKVDNNYKSKNFGESKGLSFDRVLIYPTGDMKKWIVDQTFELKDEARAKFYVGITRARYSVAIVYDYKDGENLSDTTKQKSEDLIL